MEFLQPASWPEALAMKAAHPEALPIAGGTDVMVEINFDRQRPATIIDLTRVADLNVWGMEGGFLRIGAGVTYTRIIDELGERLPGLAMASRAGDAHPPLLASNALVELASTSTTRRVPVREFYIGPKRNAMRKDELIAAFLVEPGKGPQQFSKVGTRNAMVIAVCSFAVALDSERRQVGTGIGSAAPTPVTAGEAETFMKAVLDEGGLWERPAPVASSALARFGELVAAAARPIDDVRGTAAYRTHALAVLARRSFSWAWDEYRRAASA